MSRLILPALGLMFFLQFAFGGCTSESSSSSRSTPRKASSVQIDKSAATQEQRKQLIDELRTKGIFEKVDMPGSRPHIWVGPAFYALEYDAESSFTRVVWSYYFGPNDTYAGVTLYDNYTGKEVGTFDLVSGLKMK